MEVRPGYKQTEVGAIPREWQVVQLAEIAHIKTGSRNNEDKVEDGEYPFYVRSEVVERINSYSHDCEAILVPGEGRIGSIFHFINGRFDVHQRVYAITRFRTDTSARWLHLFMSKNFGPWAMQNTVKATVDSLRLPTFQTFRVALPPLPEQRAIAAALSDVDALLGGLERLIAKKRDLKQAAMQQLLTGRTRLPGFHGEWGMKRLGESCELITKGTTPTSIGRSFTESGVNFLKAESVSESGEPIPGKIAFIDATTHKLLNRSQLREGDLLISIAGVLGRVGRVSQDILPANTNQALAIVRLGKSSELERMFLFFYLRSPMTMKQIADVNVQAAQANISLQNVRDLEIHVPPSLPEQTAIAVVLADMDAELAALEARRDKTRALKQGMMQELLTGRTRLVSRGETAHAKVKA